MKLAVSFFALFATLPALAEDVRQLDAHEHGVGALNIAIDGTAIAMELHAPGVDIVGFEYAAESDADLAAIDGAIKALAAPLDLFVMPDTANCAVTSAQAELEGGDDHDEHSEEHHDDHAEEAGHTEFHAEYALSCDNPEALSQITFAYFDMFPNAKEVEVQMITATGAQAFEVERVAPVLDLGR